jgi:hypothetical protein
LEAAMLVLAGAKTDRTQKASLTAKSSSLPSIEQPKEQIALLCDVIRELLQRDLSLVNGHENVRVACFAADDQYLRPLCSYNGVSRDFLRGYAGYVEYFNFGGAAKTSLAVAAARQHRIMIVDDAKKADEDANHPFWFFGPTQRETIQSMVAIPIGGVGDSKHASHVVCLDTGCPGFFTEDRREQYEILQRNIEPRLLYEAYIMTTTKGGNGDGGIHAA